MTVQFDAEAQDLVRRSFELAGHDPAEVALRLRLVGGELMPRFVAAGRDGDEVVQVGTIRVFVDPKVGADATVVIGVSSEHERLKVVG